MQKRSSVAKVLRCTKGPLLFVIDMEAISREFSVTYADDLVVITETEEWKENVESKTKVMTSGERQMVRQKYVRWPCGGLQ